MPRPSFLISLCILLFLLPACAPSSPAQSAPTATLPPTATTAPSATPSFTSIPTRAATATPNPTNTSTPAQIATATPDINQLAEYWANKVNIDSKFSSQQKAQIQNAIRTIVKNKLWEVTPDEIIAQFYKGKPSIKDNWANRFNGYPPELRDFDQAYRLYQTKVKNADDFFSHLQSIDYNPNINSNASNLYARWIVNNRRSWVQFKNTAFSDSEFPAILLKEIIAGWYANLVYENGMTNKADNIAAAEKMSSILGLGFLVRVPNVFDPNFTVNFSYTEGYSGN